jgi:CDP-diacylglycerol--serine O-phosphatidyltransferase
MMPTLWSGVYNQPMTDNSGTNQEVKRRHKGVYLLPNALTTGAMFAGFFSIISGINGHYSAAVIAVIVAGFLDGLDGRVARLTNTQSEFGVQYDSLSDMISFGLAPSLLAFNWSLASMSELGPFAGKLGWLAAFLFAACAALRLARFNTQVAVADKGYFQGLASPAAAGTLVATIWFFVSKDVPGDNEFVRWLIWFETIALGLLMFSRVRYFSGKTWPRGDRVPLVTLLLVVLIVVLLALDTPTVLMVIGLIYVVTGLVMTIVQRQQHRSRRSLRKSGPGEDPPVTAGEGKGEEGSEERGA